MDKFLKNCHTTLLSCPLNGTTLKFCYFLSKFIAAKEEGGKFRKERLINYLQKICQLETSLTIKKNIEDLIQSCGESFESIVKLDCNISFV